MNAFTSEPIWKIRHISTEHDLREMYRWLYTKQTEISRTAAEINDQLSLRGDFELKPDMPCLNVGSSSGMVVLAANPGWSQEDNEREDAYCRTSPAHYEDLIFNFFDTHPKVVGRRVRWWSGPINFSRELILPTDNLLPESAETKWKTAYSSRLLGGWELFPWHSVSDGISPQIRKNAWLHEFCKESILALIRLKPKVILVASKEGFDLMRHDLLSQASWIDSTAGQKSPVAFAYTKADSETEVIAIRRQIFAAFKVLTNQEILSKIQLLRSAWSNK